MLPPNSNDTGGDLYCVLGVSPKATYAEIKKAYREKVLKFHPDKQPPGASSDVFMAIQNSYAILREKESRARYDSRRTAQSTKRDNHSSTSSAHSSWEATPPPSDPRSSKSSGSPDYSSSSYTSSSKPDQQHSSRSSAFPDGAYQWNQSYWTFRYQKAEPSNGESTHRSRKSCYQHFHQNSSSTSNDDFKCRFAKDNQFKNDGGHKKTNRSSDSPGGVPIFGVKANGEPCKNCITQGGFCWQHKSQNESKKGFPRTNGTTEKNTAKPHTYSDHAEREPSKQTWGITTKGEPCKKCILQRRYCCLHEYQDTEKSGSQNSDFNASVRKESDYQETKTKIKGKQSNKARGESSSTYSQFTVYGVTNQGLPCKRCISQRKFCYQHIRQQRQ